jgi:hypothetical protein
VGAKWISPKWLQNKKKQLPRHFSRNDDDLCSTRGPKISCLKRITRHEIHSLCQRLSEFTMPACQGVTVLRDALALVLSRPCVKNSLSKPSAFHLTRMLARKLRGLNLQRHNDNNTKTESCAESWNGRGPGNVRSASPAQLMMIQRQAGLRFRETNAGRPRDSIIHLRFLSLELPEISAPK